MKQLFLIGALGALLAARASAQVPVPVPLPPEEQVVVETPSSGEIAEVVPVGTELPAPQFASFAHGEAVAFAGDQAPPCTVYVFCNGPHGAARLQADAACFAPMQQRDAARGLAIVAVVDAAPAAKVAEAWGACRIAVDAGGATARTWCSDAPGASAGAAIVVDRKGVVTFAGKPGSGLADAIAATLAGPVDLDRQRQLAGVRVTVPSMFDNLDPAVVTEQVENLLRDAPRDGEARGWLYVNLATRTGDRAAAERAAAAAGEQLAAEPRPLAAFADLALRAAPHDPALGAALAKLLAPYAKQMTSDPRVQLAYLRALIAVGEPREVVKQAFRCRKALLDTPDDCLAFAMTLAVDQNPQVHRDLVQQAVEHAGQLGANATDLVRARYVLARRCAGDAAGAKAILDGFLGEDQGRISLNNACWYALTELPTIGMFDPFALGVAERMLEQRDGMDYFEFDTAALAMFTNGRIQEAIDLQTTAIDKGGRGNPEYEQRLARYKAAAAAPPR